MNGKIRTKAPQQILTAIQPVGGILQRQCACGNHTLAGSECTQCAKDKGRLQRKLTIGASNDSLEREADQVADQVLSAPAKASISGAAPRIQRFTGHSNGENGTAPASVDRVLASGGRPLDSALQQDMGQRFGHDFSRVRIHTGDAAEQSAWDVSAHAYTVGHNIVFGAGQYAPESTAGRRLMAHELTHVVQQSGSEGIRIGRGNERRGLSPIFIGNRSLPVNSASAFSGVVQRACGPSEINEPAGCTFATSEVSGPRYLFRVNCDEFARGNEQDLRADAMTIVQGEIIEIHGLASSDGNPDFNQNLSCARALRAKAVIEEVLTARGVTATIQVFNHGATPGDATLQRSVVIVRTTLPPPEPVRRCGPDATDWFIRQVSAAKTDPVVIALQGRLLGAERLAHSYGFSAERIAEGAVAKKVLAEEARVAPPSRTAEARAQIAASAPGQGEFGRAITAAPVPLVGAPEAFVLAAIRGSALTWKGLVGTGRKYDFKNSSRTLQSPTSANCPVDCANTITFCPTTSSDCFVKDVPGNLFYAHVGRFVGWTELALQLGSQFAQLDSSARWDPPEDTRMIRFGFGLPDPLTTSDLCAEINANRSVFDLQNCSNCSEEVTADVV